MSATRQYQQDLEADIMDAWEESPNVMGVLPTGGGKTWIFSEIIKRLGLPTVAIAHRQEIVAQIALSLAKHGVRHKLIAPDNVVKLVNRLETEELGRSFYHPSASVAVAGVDTLISRQKRLGPWPASVRLWVMDECFPAGTLVDGIPIEHLKIGDFVTAFDEETGRFEKKKITHLFKNPLPDCMVRINAGGRIVNATGNHPFYTERGWVEAKNLRAYDSVLCYGPIRWAMVSEAIVYKPKDLGNYVYNIEVEDFHTYIADGFVVHNCHHILKTNKWGKAAAMFPSARGLGVTATPTRADGKGLGRHADGLFDTMVLGPGMRDLINMGFLADYRVFAPPSDIRFEEMITGSNGDWTKPSVKKAVRKSRVVGDVVEHYKRIASGKLGITFAPDVETAGDIARKFNEAGVSAAVCTAETPDTDRVRLLRQFRNRKLLQLVNVDLFGEGFDVPAVEVVSMARPTQSFGLYCQQFGRSLRPDGAKIAIIIDHVGNVIRHGLPDKPRAWTLDRRERTSRTNEPDDVIPVKACPLCTAVYERIYKACPYCGHEPEPAARSGPEWVDGDLNELDPATLARMRGEVVPVEMTRAEYLAASGAGGLPQIAAAGAAARFREKQQAQSELRLTIALWAGQQRAIGRPDSESYRLFYHLFGTDVLSAQALGRRDAEILKNRIDKHVNKG